LYQTFYQGYVFWYPQFGVHEMHGGITKRWKILGGKIGTLGFSMSGDEHNIDSGRQSDFENGHITWLKGSREITVFLHK